MGTSRLKLGRYEAYLRDFAVRRASGSLGPEARPMTPRHFTRVGPRAAGPLAEGPSVYVASPLGFSELGRLAREMIAGALVKGGMRPVDPWSHDSKAETIDDVNLIGQRNFGFIETSATVLGVLEGPAPDGGTACEVGYALGLGMKPIVLRTDQRGVRPELERWVTEAGGRVVRSLAELEQLEIEVPRVTRDVLEGYEGYLQAFESRLRRGRLPLTPARYARRRTAGHHPDEFLPRDGRRGSVLFASDYIDVDPRSYRVLELIGDVLRGRGVEIGLPWQDGTFWLEDVDRAEWMVAALDGPEVHPDVAAAVGYAAARGIRVEGFRMDPRCVGECREAGINLQVAHAVFATGGQIHGMEEELAAAAEALH